MSDVSTENPGVVGLDKMTSGSNGRRFLDLAWETLLLLTPGCKAKRNQVDCCGKH